MLYSVVSEKVKFTWQALGGLNRIGMNTMAFHFQDFSIGIDSGVMFSDPNNFGVESVFVDYKKVFENNNFPFWLITHAHEDHIGSVGAIFSICDQLGIDPPKIIAPSYAFELIKDKLTDTFAFKNSSKYLDHVILMDFANEWYEINSELRIKYFPVRHSVVDSFGIALEYKKLDKTLEIVHSSDFKIDRSNYIDGVIDENSFKVFDQPDFLFMDSTNSINSKWVDSELSVVENIKELISTRSNRLLFTMFSSNLFRLASLINIAQENNRKVAIVGRSMQRAFKIAKAQGYFGTTIPLVDYKNVISIEDIIGLPKNEQLIICSGTQGEPGSTLWKLSREMHHRFKLQPGDEILFSSRLIPGNERKVFALLNDLARINIKVTLDGDCLKPIHASGHASGKEIETVVKLVKPKNFIPVHGELRHLIANKEIALNCGVDKNNIFVVENGTSLVFEANSNKWTFKELLADPFPEVLLKFRKFFVSSRSSFIKKRKSLALNGCVLITLDFQKNIKIDTVAIMPDDDPLKKELHDFLNTTVSLLSSEVSFNTHLSETQVEKLLSKVKQFLKRNFRIKPHVSINQVTKL